MLFQCFFNAFSILLLFSDFAKTNISKEYWKACFWSISKANFYMLLKSASIDLKAQAFRRKIYSKLIPCFRFGFIVFFMLFLCFLNILFSMLLTCFRHVYTNSLLLYKFLFNTLFVLFPCFRHAYTWTK